MVATAAVALAVAMPSRPLQAEGLNVIPPEARTASPKRHDRWQQQRARRHATAPAAAPDAADYLYSFVDRMIGHGTSRTAPVRKPAK